MPPCHLLPGQEGSPPTALPLTRGPPIGGHDPFPEALPVRWVALHRGRSELPQQRLPSPVRAGCCRNLCYGRSSHELQLLFRLSHVPGGDQHMRELLQLPSPWHLYTPMLRRNPRIAPGSSGLLRAAPSCSAPSIQQKFLCQEGPEPKTITGLRKH